MSKYSAEFGSDEQGTMAVEYGILIAFLAAALIVLVGDVGEGVSDILDYIAGLFPDF